MSPANFLFTPLITDAGQRYEWNLEIVSISSRVDKDRKRCLLRNHGFNNIFESNVNKVPVPSGGHAQMMSAEERGGGLPKYSPKKGRLCYLHGKNADKG